MAINTYLSIITLNVNGLNALIKRHRVENQIKSEGLQYAVLQETHLRAKDTYRLKMRGWEKIFHANGKDRRLGALILIKDNLDFKMKTMKKYKEGHYVMRKGYLK